ncbi:MAG: multifunctional oxoglutarate decarboxylase/oxoglutarate dehydrogenase thiamine pyrophosphate-binding subunit/dihydrolipoyllysine-residue succinyltransferase subunit [bacterium]|nr:multifunctional oxoglutarate decarboxylase/oxoglutarate dehydrogenase thiamine pyrophosphate-binding subunit/dihydrolipoyllysine-residue succinyltransferase subunit [bacterium]
MAKFGHNLGYIDELFRRFQANPQAVSEAWREFFKDYRPDPATEPPRPAPAESKPAGPAPAPPAAANARPLRGIAAKIVENMAASIEVPTATSVRTIPVKMLEENRRVANLHQQNVAGPKISFTHLIAWAIVQSLKQHPGMNVAYAEIDGKPHVVPRDEIRLGLAIDVSKNGERVLLVPNIKHAEQLDFPALVAAYDDLVLRARNNELTLEDYEGTTVTLTNPGMLGTALSVPRLMQGQGAIIGVGAISYPGEYSGMAPEMISQLGISRVMSVTSTYDHRVIQGAESGRFLATLDKLLQGEQDTFARIFGEIGVPQEPLRWAGDRNPPILGGANNAEAIAKQAGVLQLIRCYRVRGHLWADLNPLGYEPEPNPELELSTYGLSVWDLDREFVAGNLGGERGMLRLRDILETLQRTYCHHIAVEYMHIPDSESRHWLQERLESPSATEPLPREMQVEILKKLNAAEAFETFLHTSYVGQKRFSLEGAETLIPMLHFLLADAAEAEIDAAVIGMAHRGRLNVLAHVVGKSYGQIFREFEGIDPRTALGSGDVKYHLGASGRFTSADGKIVDVEVASNPSHLEAVNPVVEGMVRARQDRRNDADRSSVLPLLLHGDAAFAGQGVVAETLNLSQLQGYRTGGTVHVVINNQIGFTTGPKDARSSTYATDVAKMVRAPIFHVNGDQPEEAVRVIRHALAFRQAFQRDVVVDLVCYRRWGHNEADDPSYTHPLLYDKIREHRSVRKLYTEQLLRRGDFDVETAENALEDYRRRLREVHDEVRQARQEGQPEPARRELEAVEGVARPHRDSGVPLDSLRRVLAGLERRPDGFEAHKKLARQLAHRTDRFEEGRIDWALAEALAFGSLVYDGCEVRLSGEDSGRGTFSQRHAVLYDHRNAQTFCPLAELPDAGGKFQVFDSLLSEFAVLGFEYGYSVEHPEALVLWEAQFGDFANGAQVIIDQFLVCSEQKWGQKSSLVLLLPHGYEGQGPEHSTARLERFLQLAARGNIQIASPSTPAQYFHLLRSQTLQDVRRPLVVMTPKSLLRLPACVSQPDELTQGCFEVLRRDPRIEAERPLRRLVLCSGKLFYDLDAERNKREIDDVAICCVEQLYPFPGASLAGLFEKLSDVKDIVWAQEESRNMGAWSFFEDRARSYLAEGQTLRYVGRPRSASPATGSAKRHAIEQEAIVQEALLDAPTPAAPRRRTAAAKRG